MNKVERVQTLTKALRSLYARHTCGQIRLTRKLSTESRSTQDGEAPPVKDAPELSLDERVSESVSDSTNQHLSTRQSNDSNASFGSESEDSYLPTKTEKTHSFAYLLRHSSFINLGDPRDKTVSGKIFHIVDDDLYIDFGWKFHCVCRRPQKNQDKYIRGARVKVLVRNLELSTRFLGATRDITLCEADCSLIGLSES